MHARTYAVPWRRYSIFLGVEGFNSYGAGGLHAGENPHFGQGKAKQAQSCPEPAQGWPSSRTGMWLLP